MRDRAKPHWIARGFWKPGMYENEVDGAERVSLSDRLRAWLQRRRTS